MMYKIILIIIIFLIGCNSNQNNDLKNTTIDSNGYSIHTYNNIDKIFIHTPQYISFFVQENEQLKHIEVQGSPILWFNDVPDDKEIYCTVIRRYEWPLWVIERIEVHCHSTSDINGAGWNHGKFGSGVVQEISLE